MRDSNKKVLDKLGTMLDSYSLAVVTDFLIEKNLLEGELSIHTGTPESNYHIEDSGLQWYSYLLNTDDKGNSWGTFDILIRHIPVPIYLRSDMNN